MAVEQELFRQGYQIYVLDGDNVRHGLNPISASRRRTAPRTSAASARLPRCSPMPALIVITAFISPYRTDRDRTRGRTPTFPRDLPRRDLENCEQRDPKGLYAKARGGEIADFTGVSAPYEAAACSRSSCSIPGASRYRKVSPS